MDYSILHPRSNGPDLVLELEHDGHPPAKFMIEVCAHPRLARVLYAAEQARRFANRSGGSAAVAVPMIGPTLRKALRDRGVGFLSLNGDAYLRGGGILIDRKVDRADDRRVVQPNLGNLFADKSSLILRYLLSRRALPLGIRDVAAQLGISPGLASRVASRLRREDYLVEDQLLSRLVGRDALLAQWEQFHRDRAKRQQEVRFYMHARDASSVMKRLASGGHDPGLPAWGLSFHAGASLVAPHAFFAEVHILIEPVSDDAMQAFATKLHLEPAKRDANVVVVQSYYQHSWSYGLREIDGLPVVSDVQLYLDLSAYPRRGHEQAERIKERIVALENEEPGP